MIGSLRGTLLDRSMTGEALVEVGGVGYRVQVPAPALAALGELGGPVFLHVHTYVREDAIVLYGFPTLDERGCFEALLGAHGVGPAMAVAILSIHSPSALRRIVATEDVEALTLGPGVGKKTAARLLLELASRLGAPDDGLGAGVVSLVGGPPTAQSEVKSALVHLGYGADEVRLAVQDLPADGQVEDLLRLALRTLAAVR